MWRSARIQNGVTNPGGHTVTVHREALIYLVGSRKPQKSFTRSPNRLLANVKLYKFTDNASVASDNKAQSMH
jgi:hypothetical protein